MAKKSLRNRVRFTVRFRVRQSVGVFFLVLNVVQGQGFGYGYGCTIRLELLLGLHL